MWSGRGSHHIIIVLEQKSSEMATPMVVHSKLEEASESLLWSKWNFEEGGKTPFDNKQFKKERTHWNRANDDCEHRTLRTIDLQRNGFPNCFKKKFLGVHQYSQFHYHLADNNSSNDVTLNIVFEREKQGDNICSRIPSTTPTKTLDGAFVDLVEDA